MSTKEAVVIILDVGKNTLKTNSKRNKNFFELAKECVEKIIQRKIFSDPKHEIGLILMGTQFTNNNLNVTVGGYEHISEAFHLSVAKWQMLRVLDQDVQPCKTSEADWFDALVVGVDFLKNQTIGGKYQLFKIVLLTTFSTFVNNSNVDPVIQVLKDMNIQLIVITDSVEYHLSKNYDIDEDGEEVVFSQNISKSKIQTDSEELITDILKQTNGVLSSFDQALIQLLYFDKANKRAMPWNCKLEFGTKLNINASVYVYMKNSPCLNTWKRESADGPCRRMLEYYVDDTPLDPEEVPNMLRGFMYGDTPVPFDETLGMSFNAGDQCFKCIGFTDAQLIHDEHLVGSGVWIVRAQQNCETSEKKLTALISAMQDANMAMLVRYIYRNGTKVKIMALFTHKTCTGKKSYKTMATLKMLEVYFSDNHRFLEFPKLESNRTQPTEKQYHAIDDLIDSMNLINVNENDSGTTEYFPNKKIIDPTIQHIYRTIAHRAIYPTQPIPTPGSDILQLINVPKPIQEASASKLLKIKEVFPMEKIIKPGRPLLFKKLQQNIDDGQDNTTSNINSAVNDNDVIPIDPIDVIAVGTINPAEDFALLLNQGEQFSTLCTQIQNVLSDLIFKTVAIQTEKVEKAIMIYREEARLLGPYRYNEWISELKTLLLDRSKVEFWENVIVKNKFGLISVNESEMSTVADEEAFAFYKCGSKNTNHADEIEADDEEGDLDDLLGNM